MGAPEFLAEQDEAKEARSMAPAMATAGEMSELLKWLPAIPLPPRLEPLRECWRNRLNQVIAELERERAAIVFRPVGGAWLLGRKLIRKAPPILTAAHQALRGDQVRAVDMCAPGTAERDARTSVRNRLRNAERWLEAQGCIALAEVFSQVRVVGGVIVYDPVGPAPRLEL